MYNDSGKVVVEGLASHIDDDFKHERKTGLKLIFTKFIRLSSARQFIQHFVKREYCPGSTDYNCLDGDGIFPDPEDSSAFYICSNNLPTKERCPYRAEFNAKHVSCIAVDDSNDRD